MSSKSRKIILWGDDYLSRQNKPVLQRYVQDRPDVFRGFSQDFREIKKGVLCTRIVTSQTKYKDRNQGCWTIPSKFADNDDDDCKNGFI